MVVGVNGERTDLERTKPRSIGGVKLLLDDLRSARVLVVHPQDEEGEMLIRQLKRIGCDVRAIWPSPNVIPEGIDTVFVLIGDSSLSDVPWRGDVNGPAIVAIVDYESPTSLKAVIDWNAHGVINKPVRSFGILSSLVLARYQRGYQSRLSAKVRKLEETLKARREIERATKILMKLKNVSDNEAYQLLRGQATSKRVTLSEVATGIIAAFETFGNLGIGLGPADE